MGAPRSYRPRAELGKVGVAASLPGLGGFFQEGRGWGVESEVAGKVLQRKHPWLPLGSEKLQESLGVRAFHVDHGELCLSTLRLPISPKEGLVPAIY